VGISIIAPRVSINNTVSATAALLGSTSSVALSVFRTVLRDAFDSAFLSTGTAITNNRQVGGSLAYSWRLSPRATATVVIDYSRIEALDDVVGGGRTQQGGIRAQVSLQVAPKSFTRFGAQYRKLGSGVVTGGEESLAFVELDHAF
jgi:hypothetical protein